MPVNLTNLDIGTRYALQEDFNNGFVGRDRQVVIQTDDPKGYRPVIMDGKTTGGKSKVALVDDLTDYATKTELNGKANATHSHAISDVTNLQSTINTKVNMAGARGNLAGYEETAIGNTVSATSQDCQIASGTVTVSNGSAGQAWTKVVKLGSAVTVNLGSSFRWANGEAPEIKAPAILVCHWNNDAGIAMVTNGAA